MAFLQIYKLSYFLTFDITVSVKVFIGYKIRQFFRDRGAFAFSVYKGRLHVRDYLYYNVLYKTLKMY